VARACWLLGCVQARKLQRISLAKPKANMIAPCEQRDKRKPAPPAACLSRWASRLQIGRHTRQASQAALIPGRRVRRDGFAAAAVGQAAGCGLAVPQRHGKQRWRHWNDSECVQATCGAACRNASH